MQDVSRLYKQEERDVQVTLVESNQILGSFDERLRAFAEKKIKQRDRFQLVQASVTGGEAYTVICLRFRDQFNSCLCCQGLK